MRKKVKKMTKGRISKLFQLLLFTTIIVVCYSYSKFYVAQAGNVIALIGKPITSSTIENIILDDMIPGETKEYRFKISNNDLDKVSDINMQYTIEIKSEHLLPISFELYLVESDAILGNNLLANNATELIEMGTSLYEKEYQLNILWDETQNDYKYSDEIDCVSIVLNSYQVDEN